MSRHLSLFALLLIAAPAFADPCGMVPPIYPGETVPLARVGEQRTYVFYKDGVETFVIRPGFTGKVDEFGMLIPFPTPPAIRKVPDNIFEHVAAAVDPPEVVVDRRPRYFSTFGAASNDSGTEQYHLGDLALRREAVNVLREEAVGMYEVAVLAAGSADALKKWLDDHGYKYPDGMDKPCNEYVEAGWCFVAVKTKVGQKAGVEPKPGQRSVEPKLPDGAIFDGYVQAMGFRFESEELVVPMRLSAFNDGELRNIVYLLADKPQKIRAIPEEYVVRQLPGKKLFSNLTEPLPLRIIGGTEAEIPASRRASLEVERNPAPKNGTAKELFASDLLAVKTGELSLPHEEREKELLRIGERLGLRGAEIDKLHQQAVTEEREKTVKAAVDDVKTLTLTVVDGDFPRSVLAMQNLTFAEYRMPAARNKATVYDAKTKSPAPKQPGVLKTGRLDPVDRTLQEESTSQSIAWKPVVGIVAAVSLSLVGLIVILRCRRSSALLFFLAASCLFVPSPASADGTPKLEKGRAYVVLMNNGRVESGTLKSISDDAIELVNGKGRTVRIIRSEIEEIVPAKDPKPQPALVAGPKYALQFVKPKIDVDYKITLVRPDPVIDFKMLNAPAPPHAPQRSLPTRPQVR